jgi:hypothetical protein
MTVRGRLALCLAVLFGVICFLYRYLTFRGFSNDHFLHVARAQQMLLGELPIRDFLDPGMPLMYALSAAAQALFGRMLLSEAILVFGCLGLAAALTCWVILRVTGSIMLAAVLTLLQILVLPALTSYPKIVLYPVAVVAIDRYARAPGTARAAVLAIVTAVSFLMRYDHGIFVAAGCAAAIVAVHWNGGRLQVLRSIRTYALATAVILSPYFLYIQWAEGLVPYFSDAIAFSRAESGNYPVILPALALDPRTALTFPRREATIHVRWAAGVDASEREILEARFGLTADQPAEGPTRRYRIADVSRPGIERIVRHPSVEDTAGIDRPSFTVEADRFADACVVCVAAGPGLHLAENTVAWLYYVTWGTVAAGGALAIFGGASVPVVGAMTIMTAMAASTFLRSILPNRITDIWGLLPLLLASTLAARPRGARWQPLVRVAGALVFAVTAGAVLIAGDTREEFNFAALTTGPVSSSALRIAARFRQVTQTLVTPQDALHHLRKEDTARRTVAAYVALCTRPADRLFVFSFAPELFWETQRGFAAGYAAFVRGAHASDAAQRRGIARWRAQSVPVAIAFEGQYAEMAEAFPMIADELRQRYSLVYRQETVSDRGSIMVFAERGRTVEGTYEPLGTPCFTAREGASRKLEAATDNLVAG